MTETIDKSNPWQTISSRSVYDNPWINVREDKVIQPSGTPGLYGIVHFKNKAMGIAAVDHMQNIYLVGQYRYPLNIYSWEIPEGGCPDNEEPILAAKRELLEETGLTAKRWQYLGQSHLSNSVSDEAAIYYLATELEQGQAQPEENEKLSLKKIPLEKALEMVMSGGITDSLSMIAIMHCAILFDIKSPNLGSLLIDQKT